VTVIGFARVSTTDQNLDIQLAALKAAGADIIRAEKQSGTTTRGPHRAPDSAGLPLQGRHVACDAG
jgi:DNA invertase Pin-like site-specific DNA recombinase